MKSALSSLLLLAAAIFLTAPLRADSIPSDSKDAFSFWNASQQSTQDFGTGSYDSDPSKAGLWLGSSALPDDPLLNCSWTPDPATHSLRDSDGWRWGDWDHDGDHDGDRDDPKPVTAVSEPESLWLFLAGALVFAFCQLIRRTVPITPR